MTIRGLLLDLEGVLYQGEEPIPGAALAIGKLIRAGIEVRYLTNTTTRPRRAIVERLLGMGFEVSATQLFTPGIAASRLLKQRAIRRIHLAAPVELAEDLADFGHVDEGAQAIVLGDLHNGFSWDRLNGLFQMMQRGATLIALHKNRYCRRGDAIALDLGPYVAALDYAADSTADVVGKPSLLFFQLALDDLHLPASDVAMVGDDIEADIGGAQQAGMVAIQVKTGKFTAKDLDHPAIQPDYRIESAAQLDQLLRQLG